MVRVGVGAVEVLVKLVGVLEAEELVEVKLAV